MYIYIYVYFIIFFFYNQSTDYSSEESFLKKTVHHREFIIHISLYLLPRELLQTLARIFRNNLLCIVFEWTQNIRCANSVYGEIIYSSDDTRIVRLDIVSSLPIKRHKRKYFMSMSRVKKRKKKKKYYKTLSRSYLHIIREY